MKKLVTSLNFYLIFVLFIISAYAIIIIPSDNICSNSNRLPQKRDLDEKSDNIFSLSYTPHGPVDITSDSGFSAYGFPGSGTYADPYIIQGFNFTATAEFPKIAVSISDTTKYFVIRDCYINSNSEGTGGFGIRVLYTAEGTVSIINNTVIDNFHGIYLSGCRSSIVSDNYCIENSDAIELTSCPQSTVNNNTCNFNGRGIDFSKCSDTLVFNNIIENNYGVGIQLYGEMSNCLVFDNILKENRGYAVNIQIQSSKNFLYLNTFVDNNIDGTFQGRDDGKRNKWYNDETEEGNYWSDLSEECTYLINGYSKSKDLYPLNRADTCPNPKTGSTLAIVLPIFAFVGILSFIIPKYIIPYHREKSIIKRFTSFIERRKRIINVLSVIIFIAGTFTMLTGLYIRLWNGELEPSIIIGAVIALSALCVIIPSVIKRIKSKKENKIYQSEFKKL